jgi:glutamate/aspartate transport system permease protein
MQYSWDWLIFLKPSVTGEGLYAWMLVRGLAWTVGVSLISWFLALAIGVAVGVLRTVPQRMLRVPAAVFVHCFRNTPLLVQLFLWYFVVPELLPMAWGDAIKQMNPTTNQFLTVLACLTLYTGAKAAEQVRAGIDSVPASQRQAALALGLGIVDSYRHVILPQALRIAIAPTVGFSVQVVKGTAVTSIIGFAELTKTGSMLANATFEPFLVFGLVAAGYFALCYPLSLYAKSLERKFHVAR